MEVMEVNRENMCVILIDKGVVDDHLPNHVLHALKTCKTRFMSSPGTYDRETIQKLRDERKQLLSHIRLLKLAHETSTDGNPNKRFFMGESPVEELPGEMPRSLKHSHLMKQNNIEMTSLRTSPVTANGRVLEAVPNYRKSSLSRISECTDEDDVSKVSEVTGRAGVVESVIVDMDESDGIVAGLESRSGQFETKHSISESAIHSQASETIGHSIDSPISSLPPTPASIDEGDVFSDPPPAGERPTRSSWDSRPKTLSLRSTSGSSTESMGSNKLLARRNVSNERLRLNISTDHDP
jgi:hypothetical protein